MMNQGRNKAGQFTSNSETSNRTLVSARLLPELAQKLAQIPNRSKYIEGVLLDRVAEVEVCKDYQQQWEELQGLRSLVNCAILKLAQYEEKCDAGDELLRQLKADVGALFGGR